MADPPQLDASERDALLAAYDRLLEAERRPDRGCLGCFLILLATAVLVAVPQLTTFRRTVGWAWLGTVAILTLIGVYFVVVGRRASRWQYTHFGQSAEQALHLLRMRYDFLTEEERRNAALSLIVHSRYSDGGRDRLTINPERACAELHNALPYVRAVEDLLFKERKAHLVFAEPDK